MSVPKLRFKEFDGDFEKNKLVAYTKWSSGGTPSKDNDDYWNGDIPLISGASMHTQKFFESDVNITELGLKKGSKLAPKDSILILVRGSMLFNKIPMGLTLKDVAFNQDVKCIQPTQSLNSSFLFQWFFAKENIIQNKVSSTGIGAGKLDTADLQNLEIVVPKLEEQTQIASFLSAVDEKISQLTQKHELLSQYKQGMMQKLFSQQIRFKAYDGSEFGEWEEKTLIDSIDSSIKWSFTGGPFGSNLKSDDYTESGIRIIQLQNIGDGLFLNDYKIFTSLEKADELLSCNIYPNEILISKMGDPVARCCIVPNHHDRYLMCSDGIRLVVNKNKYSTHFMFYQINYQDFRQKASDVSTGSTRKRIGLSDLKQLPILVPCLDEQTKIANFLSSIDQKIEVVAQQIEQAKQWKKGLLQQMFV
ncbi:type I restriction enzyme S subunit [Acinetobacter johnsonii]|uniref:restriction endonuclease subunit S n=1 Tax=Acinetobacter johnsonii TaxID=40214 RepID=UPI001612EC65|nr:restriction endonuclease subunit S [Acinetobacter johnsonii]MBB4809346.1 type I restriction enzyme S subunit [Acinetobacter johnsonii]